MEAKALGEKIFGDDDSISEEEKTATAKRVFDAVLEGFSTLKKAIASAKYRARTIGYTETILGRRRHFPNAQLPLYEFTAMKGYVNPDIDPLNPETFNAEAGIPKRIQDKLYKELSSYKHKGQVYRRIKELAAEGIKVTRNENLIKEAERQSWNHCLDYDTEILTTSGWKRHDEVQIGDEILSYNMNTQHIELDTVLSIYDNPDVTDVVRFKSQSFEMVSTEDHRWVVGKHNEVPYIKTTADICRHKYADYPILRVADNNLQENAFISDAQLMHIAASATEYNLSYNLISTLSQRQAHILLLGIMRSDNISEVGTSIIHCKSKQLADAIQYLCFMAGYASTMEVNSHGYYNVALQLETHTIIESAHETKTQGVWCVTTNNSTWVCRRNGVVTITGNCVQGKPNRLNCSFTVNPITQGCSI